MIPDALQEIAEAITQSKLKLPQGTGDARRDSATAEEKIISWLQNQKQQRWIIHSPNIDAEHNREWYDLTINGLYCDIKVSELAGADNTNAKGAVYYFLTGKNENIPNRWDRFFKEMAENENPSEERDFYFIVIYKKTMETFIVSLKGIGAIRPAHNNPPFQCEWSKSKIPVERDWEEAKKHLLKCWASTIKKGIETYQSGMPTYFPEFFK